MPLSFQNMNMLGMNNFGGCGMFGMSGMGMGGMSPMGMFGSIFGGGLGGNMFYNCCDGTYDYDAMAGYAVGGVIMNVAAAGISAGISSAKENSKKTMAADLESLQDEKANLLEKADMNENALKNFDIKNSTQQTTYNNAKKAYNANQEIITKYNSTKVEETIRLYKEYVETKKSDSYDTEKCGNLPTKQEYDEALKQQKAYNEAKANETRLKAEMDKAKKALDDYETKINGYKEDLAGINEEIAALQSDINLRAIKKANGNRFNRVTDTEIDALFNEQGKINEGTVTTQQQVKTMFNKYIKGTPEERKALKPKIVAMYAALPASERSNTIIKAYDALMKEQL